MSSLHESIMKKRKAGKERTFPLFLVTCMFGTVHYIARGSCPFSHSQAEARKKKTSSRGGGKKSNDSADRVRMPWEKRRKWVLFSSFSGFSPVFFSRLPESVMRGGKGKGTARPR